MKKFISKQSAASSAAFKSFMAIATCSKVDINEPDPPNSKGKSPPSADTVKAADPVSNFDWPFRLVRRERYDALTETEKGMLQSTLGHEIDALLIKRAMKRGG